MCRAYRWFTMLEIFAMAVERLRYHQYECLFIADMRPILSLAKVFFCVLNLGIMLPSFW